MKKKADIAVCISTYNEEENIAACLKSAHLLTKNVVVVDMESKDKTTDMANKMGVKVFSFPHQRYVERARNFAIEKAKADWVFILDADERITKKLAEEIENVIARSEHSPTVIANEVKQSHNSLGQAPQSQKEIATLPTVARNDKITYFKIPRKNIFARVKWLKFGGWYPDYQIRLIKKQAFIDWPKEIHSTPKIKGEGSFLKNPLIHYFHTDLHSMVEKTAIFEDIESDLLLKAGRDVSVLTFFRKFLGELFRRLIARLGFLDGVYGIMESVYQAFSKAITYIFLYEKKYKKTRRL